MELTPTSRFITLRDGVQVRILEWSRPEDSPGVPILLVHGLASNARLWDGPARRLAELGNAVVAVDLRGHGLSEKPDDGYELSLVADDIADVIKALHPHQSPAQKPLVIGQSWGGNLVVELAHRHPELIRGIVAVDGGTIELSKAFPNWDECERTLRPPAIAGMQYDRLRSYIRAAHADWSEEAIDGQMYNMEKLDDGTIRPHLTMERHIKVLHGLWQHMPSTLWENISVPVLFTPAAKQEDDHTRAKRAQIAHALRVLPRAKVEWFEPADHDLHAQFPLRFAAVVDDALSTGFFS
jgi:pimeloyl-ACP methyl ester carboxylesterase